ncbi:MAG: pyridoxamine 5'-phosphate oxidase [Dermatophilaceae bacterium]
MDAAADAPADRAPVRRVDYTGDGVTESEIPPAPLDQVLGWVDDAVRRAESDGDVPEPTALAVATVDDSGHPNVRTVLMRVLDQRGPGFFTATTSAKGRELADNPAIAAGLTWASMFRAVRFRGVAEPLDAEEVQRYFASRPWGSRISAWTSRQSEPVASRADLQAEYDCRAAEFPDHGQPDDVPVPPFWGGYRIRCDEVELWAGRRNRLHDRLVYSRVGGGGLDDAASWQVSRRQP